uniref:Uncharacterized protein n=1 Tax=Steinernema glaseri TaxID=37863 RepID=A0A1I7YD18_9BILA
MFAMFTVDVRTKSSERSDVDLIGRDSPCKRVRTSYVIGHSSTCISQHSFLQSPRVTSKILSRARETFSRPIVFCLARQFNWKTSQFLQNICRRLIAADTTPKPAEHSAVVSESRAGASRGSECGAGGEGDDDDVRIPRTTGEVPVMDGNADRSLFLNPPPGRRREAVPLMTKSRWRDAEIPHRNVDVFKILGLSCERRETSSMGFRANSANPSPKPVAENVFFAFSLFEKFQKSLASDRAVVPVAQGDYIDS